MSREPDMRARSLARLLPLALVAACVVDHPSPLGSQCELASECAAPLTCRLDRCRNPCRASRDCALGVSCAVDAEGLGACLLPEETRCGLDSDCPVPLACRMGVCANVCITDRDCADGATCDVAAATCIESADRCLSDADCEGSSICGPFGTCVAECRENRDCTDDAMGVCRAGSCFYPSGPCSDDTDCDDGLFCNGVETCDPLRAEADARGCAPSDEGPCASDMICDELADVCGARCDLAPDADADGQDAVACGGTDCDDSDPLAFMGATERCNASDDDCDTRVDEGFDLASDPEHCGACGNACPSEGTLSECADGMCRFTCDAGFADCDGRAENGCEAELASDPDNCGTCGNVCPLARACASSACASSPIVEVVAGARHTCARRASGGVLCFGDNERGQIGNGSLGTDAPTPSAVAGIDDAVALAAGQFHTCALLRDGSTWCWGDNGAGQLGDGTLDDRAVPVRVRGPASGAELETGAFHTCVRTAASVVACWGSNESGQLGSAASLTSTEAVPIPGLTRDVRDLFVGNEMTCGALPMGDARCVGVLAPAMFGTATLRDIVVGDRHACGIDPADHLRCWGMPSLATGSGAEPGATVPGRDTPVSVVGLESIAVDRAVVSKGGASVAFSCALARSGRAYCFGKNTEGQLGSGDTTDRSVATEVLSVTNAVDVAAGTEHACAVLSDGAVRCWGNNDHGQLGNTTAMGIVTSPVAVELLP